MQKRILGYFDGLATANVHTAKVHTAKTNKVQPASQTEKTAKTSVSGFYKARKIAVVLMLLVFSVFCAIGSADWIISQQMKIEGGTTSPSEPPKSAFELDESALQAHIEIAEGVPEATVPSKARANSPSDAASATTTAAANATAPNGSHSPYNGTALTVKLNNKPTNAAKNLVDNDNASTVKFKTKYITWDGTASLTQNDFISATSANAVTDGMPTNAGKYAIYVQLVGYTGENGATNLGYAIKYHEITPLPVEITWENTTFTYNGTNQQPTYTHTALCGSDKLTLTITQGNTAVTEAKNAGTYTATLSASENYALSNNTTEFTITKKNVTITWGNIPELTYNGEAQQPEYTSSALCGSDKLTLTIKQGDTVVTEAKNAGTYTATLSASENYALTNNTTEFTITKKNVTITWGDIPELTYNGKDQSSSIKPTANILEADKDKVTVSFTPGEIKNARDYTLTASLTGEKAGNYTIASGETISFKINPYELIIEWSNTELTYNGNPQKPTATITKPISVPMPEVIVSGSETDANTTDKPNYEAKASVNDDTNYTIKLDCESTPFTIKQLNVTLNTLIQKDYAQGGIKFDSSLITFDNALANSEITLTSATAKNNISGEKSETAGLFSYTYKKTATTDVYIKEGSTYLISDLKFEKINGLNSQIDNYIINSGSIYLKYKTAKVGNTYYTIEDALPQSEDTLPQSGDIVLESGDSSKNDTYVITAFSKVGFYNGGSYSFSTSRNIIVPHAAGKTASETETTTWSNENVGSVLIIPEGVSLTMNSSTLDILATVVHRGTNDVCSTGIHGVVMNQGTLTVSGAINNGNTPNIRAYGYLKGNGNVNVESNATVEDLFHIYDFKGGKNTYQLHNDAENYLPISAYSIHNISCNIKVNSDCVYNAFYKLEMGNKWFSGLIPIVGQSNAKSALFKLSNGYIEKKAIPAKSDKTNINALNTITGSNQIKGQKEDVRITGTAVDGAISISASIKILISIDVTMKTGPSTPLPIPYMDIRVCDGGNLSLGNSSYKFMPGSSLMVDEGGTLSLSSGSNLVLYSTEECSQYEKPEGATSYTYDFMTKYCVDKINSYFEVNSSSVIINGGVSGKIVSTTEQVQLNLKNASATIKTIKSFTAGELSGASQRDVTMYATGDIITGVGQTTTGATLSANTTYKSYEYDGKFYWITDSAIKTITLDLNGGTYNGSKTITDIIGATISLPSASDVSKTHYNFAGWKSSADGIIYTDTITMPSNNAKLTAQWTAKTYTINFKYLYNETELQDGVTNTNPSTFTCEAKGNLANASFTGYTFDKWYIDNNFTTYVTDFSDLIKYLDGETVTLYGKFIKQDEVYKVTYNVNGNTEILSEIPEEYVTKGTSFTPTIPEEFLTNRTDTTKQRYFLYWCREDGTEFDGEVKSDITLYAKWAYKAEVKATVPYNNKEIFLGYAIGGEEFSFTTADVNTIIDSNNYKFIGVSGTPAGNYSTATLTKVDTTDLNNITVGIKINTVTLQSSAHDLTITTDVRQIYTVTITMSAQYNRWNKFTIDSLTLTGGYYSADNSSWTKTNSVSPNETGETKFYVLSGKYINGSFTQSDTTINVITSTQKHLSGLSTKTYYVKTPTSNGNFQITGNGKDGFSIRINDSATIVFSEYTT